MGLLQSAKLKILEEIKNGFLDVPIFLQYYIRMLDK